MRLRWLIGLAVAATALIVAGGALGVGPWPGLAPSVAATDGSMLYSAKSVELGAKTRVTARRVGDLRAARSILVKGGFGIPAVTVTGAPGGLSADGRTLVLAQFPSLSVLPITRSLFLVLSTAPLQLRHTITLRGDFGFDALSPDGRTLFLIQRRSSVDARYSVRAFDLRTLRLLPDTIVDKTEPDGTMRGFPVARAQSAGGTWVYTLYRRVGAEPFVHALNTRGRYAVCVDLVWRGKADDLWATSLELTSDGRQVLVRSPRGETVARIDTRTLQLVK